MTVSIQQIYKNNGYLDIYFLSIVFIFMITILLFCMVAFVKVMENKPYIVDNWATQRCRPAIIPIAGFIARPLGVSATDYTFTNFNYCLQNSSISLFGYLTNPLNYVVSVLTTTMGELQTGIQAVRQMFDKIRNGLEDITNDIYSRMLSVIIELQQMILSVRDMMNKIHGTLTASLYTFLGTYFALQSALGAVAKLITTILIVMVGLIASFWAVPFTWGMAISTTAIFTAVSIPMALFLTFMKDHMHVNTGLSLPKLKAHKLKCFDENTMLPLYDGSTIRIADIRVGMVLYDNNVVNAVIQVVSQQSVMYDLNGVYVSDSHLCFNSYSGEYCRVCNHPDAVPLSNYNKPYLWCLNTSKKYIYCNNILFTDWDEELATQIPLPERRVGFNDVYIMLNNKQIKKIEDVLPYDVLYKNNMVYGIVKMQNNMHHLLTDNTFIHINNKIHKDYN